MQRYDAFQGLPRDRQAVVRSELQSLRKMPFPERRARLNSPEFQEKFSPEEQRLLRESFPAAARPGPSSGTAPSSTSSPASAQQ